jgi:hypothetical protein
MFDEAAQADVCDGAFVILFAEDWYGGEKISMGPLPGCENIITFGWIAGETIEWDVEGGSVDFRIDGLGKWLRQMPAIPFTLKYKSASASKWSEMTDMDTLRILYHICHERSTLTMITDVTLPDDARISPDITIGQSSLWQQLEDVAGRIFARPACDRYGRLFVEVDPQATPEADRDFPTVMTITQQDIVERLTWDRRTQATTSMLDMSGKTLGSNNKVVNYYSKATGHDDLREGARETVDNILTDDQAQLNEICGLVMGWRNNPWNTLPINLAQNNRFIDIAPRQYLEITAEAADSPRELEFSGRVIPRSVELVWNMEDGTLTTQLECEAESFPMLAIDGDAPPEPVTPPPPPIPPTPPPTPPPVPGALPPNAIVLLQGIGIYYTENLDTTTAGGQKWFPMNDGLPDPTLVRHVEISSSGNCYCQYSNESIWYARLGGVWEMIFHTDDIGNPESKPYPRGPQVVAFGIDRDADDTLLILAGLTLTIYSQFAMYCWYGSHNSLTLTSSVHVNVNYGFRSGGSLTYGDGLWLASYSTTTGKYALKLSGNGASAMSETYFGDWDDIAAVTVQGRLSPGIVLANETIPLLSTDGGATFDALASAPVPYWTSGYFEWGESMANNEDGSKIVIAVDDVIGFRRSSDSGATWENTLMPGVCKAVWHLGGDGYLFSAGTVFLLFTPDFGETYEDVTGDLYEQVGLFSVLQIRTL